MTDLPNAGRSQSPLLVRRFEYLGFHGCPGLCDLELIRLTDGRTVVIAIELADDPGTSITNVAEHLASFVCDRFGIDPDKLIWIEHYGFGRETIRERTFERVTFVRRVPDGVTWSPAVTRHKPDGWPGHFQEPEWRPMGSKDWEMLGLSARVPAQYPESG